MPVIEESFRRTEFERIDSEKPVFDHDRLLVPPALVRSISRESFRRIAFFFRKSHLILLTQKYHDPDSSENDRFVIGTLLENACVAAKGSLSLCQDAGTVVIYGWKNESIYTGADDAEELAQGALESYRNHSLRASQIGAHSFFEEYNTGENQPVQVHIEAYHGVRPQFRFLFAAKGGGSSNKTAFFSLSKAFLEKGRFEAFLEEQIRGIGTDACPPYRLAIVVGGTSPELNLEILKLATTEILDPLPYDESSWIFRDQEWEHRVLDIAKKSTLGAQFKGSDLALDARVIRLPRHAASCPVSIGLSCCAHRNALAYIDQTGVYLEKLCTDPAGVNLQTQIQRVDLDSPNLRETLSHFVPGDTLLISGTILIARDAAHYKWAQIIDSGQKLPDYLLQYPIFYAGPSVPPPGAVIGSIGPTTAGRMDDYADMLMSRGASLITIAKGGRSGPFIDACKKYGGFYLGAIGGAAALFAEQYVITNEIIDYPELGMEAVRIIRIKDVPVFMVIDSAGHYLFSLN
ncbi:fumarate hydratase class I [Spirochaetia bacterium]|nr:fumarate hydratase class I [Spirochaetia bacterium]